MPDNLTDPSRSTAQFRAFVQGTEGEAERSWAMKTPRRNVAVLAAIVIGVAIVIALISLAIA
jgi:multisubunit Na+/H+ antiporter MnhC subunit